MSSPKSVGPASCAACASLNCYQPSQIGSAVLIPAKKVNAVVQTCFTMKEFYGGRRPPSVTNPSDPRYLGSGGEAFVSQEDTRFGPLALKIFREDKLITLRPGIKRGDFATAQLEDGAFATAKGYIIRKANEDFFYTNFEALNKEIDQREASINTDLMIIKQQRKVDLLKSRRSSELEEEENLLEYMKDHDRLKMVGIFMELLKGHSLDHVIDGPQLDVSIIINFSIQLLKAIQKMHAKGVVHRDIKAENIFVADGQLPGDPKTIKICDFGLAIKVERDERMSTACGTFLYAAPERLMEIGYTETIDDYAAGIIMFAMICRRLPFEHENTSDLINTILRYGWKNGSLEDRDRDSFEDIQQIRRKSPILADVIVGLTRGAKAHRMPLQVAIEKLEAAFNDLTEFV